MSLATNEESNLSTECVSQEELNRFDWLKWFVFGLLLFAPLLYWLLLNLPFPPPPPTEPSNPELVSIASSLENLSHTLISMEAIMDAQDQGQAQHIDIDVHVNGAMVVTPSIPATPQRAITVTKVVQEKVEVEVTRVVTVEVPITVTVPTTETIYIVKTVPSIPTIQPFTPEPGRACTRFNFEVGRNQATGSLESGTYVMTESLNNRIVSTWHAEKGWKDSGWIRHFAISADSVHIKVRFHPDSGGFPVDMEIVNPASGTEYGWLTNGLCHAIEIQFPESQP